MTIDCPQCGAVYDGDAAGPDGLACCHGCGAFFSVATGRVVPLAALSTAAMTGATRLTAARGRDGQRPDAPGPPFESVADLAPIEPAGGIGAAAGDRDRHSAPDRWYLALAFVLAAVFATQLAWLHQRDLLSLFPRLAAVCDHLPCRPSATRAAEAFQVVERELVAAEGRPGALTFRLRFRNSSETPKPLPDIQLSLLDNGGEVLIRRRLSPVEYLAPDAARETDAAPGETVAARIDFADPGYRATGFRIDFP